MAYKIVMAAVFMVLVSVSTARPQAARKNAKTAAVIEDNAAAAADFLHQAEQRAELADTYHYGVKTLNSADEFYREVQENDRVAVVFFANDYWCNSCPQFTYYFEAFSYQFTNVIFCKIDVEYNPDIFYEAGIFELPTFQFYRHGYKDDSLVGVDDHDVHNLYEKLQDLNSK